MSHSVLQPGTDQIRVLLVEDSPGDAVLIQKHLSKARESRLFSGIEVDSVESLTDAIDAYENKSFDVILLDLGLPESRGLTTLERMREVCDFTPIVVLTGLEDDDLAYSAVSAGADDFLQKNELRTNALLRSLRYAIDRAERSHELRVKNDAMDFAELAMLLVDRGPEGERNVYTNRAFEKMTGYTSDEMASRTIEDLLDMETNTTELDQVRDSDGQETQLRFDSVLETAGGDHFWVSVGVLAISRDGGGRRQILYTLEDVSARHEMLTRLADLDRMITLGTLSAAVAHEINNPLSFIGGNVQYALKELEKVADAHPELGEVLENASEALVDALDGSRRVRVVVEDLRDLAGGGVADAEAMRDRISVTEALKTSLSMVRKQVEYRATLDVDVPEELPQVLGNSSKLGQVFLNLVLNAAQAIPGRVEDGLVQVRAHSEPESVVIEVEDNGEGIPDDQIERIFEPFFSTKSSQEGTGLGLAICKQTLARMGGQIEVESVPDEGTVFRVILPTVNRRLREWSEISEARVVENE